MQLEIDLVYHSRDVNYMSKAATVVLGDCSFENRAFMLEKLTCSLQLDLSIDWFQLSDPATCQRYSNMSESTVEVLRANLRTIE
jgi:hypothetical protein